jgi:asparagine synthase (glutamine-hydrolysing)
MRWIAGTGLHGSSSAQQWLPKNSVPIVGIHQIWQSTTAQDRANQAVHGDFKLTLIGDCFATRHELGLAAQCISRGDILPLTELPGSFLSVIDGPAIRMVFGDLSGNVRVYYTTDEFGNYWWSTAATPLAALIGATVSHEQLLSELTVYGTERYGGATPFPGVHALEPGSSLELKPQFISTRQWHIPSSHTTQEGAGLFRKALTTSVSVRSNPQQVIAADFSGGMDSTTLAVLAAKDTSVRGVTYFDQWMASDDLSYAKTVAATVPNLKHLLVQGDECTVHYADLDPTELPLTDLPSMDAIMLGYNRAKLEAVGEGVSLYLNGMAGDCVLHSPMTRLADQYLVGQKLEAVKSATAEARRRTSSPARMVQAMRRLATTSYRHALQELARTVLDPRVRELGEQTPDQALTWCRLMPSSSWLTPEAATVISQWLESYAMKAKEHRRPGDFHTWLGLWETTAMRQTTNAYARARGIRPQPVFTDTAVVQSAFGVPTYDRATRTSFKPLLRMAFGDILPAVLTQRLTKGDFGGTMYQGLKNNQASIRQIIRESRLVEAGLLDGRRVEDDLTRAVLGLRAPLSGFHTLVAAELWLTQLNLRKDIWWTQI